MPLDNSGSKPKINEKPGVSFEDIRASVMVIIGGYDSLKLPDEFKKYSPDAVSVFLKKPRIISSLRPVHQVMARAYIERLKYMPVTKEGGDVEAADNVVAIRDNLESTLRALDV